MTLKQIFPLILISIFALYSECAVIKSEGTIHRFKRAPVGPIWPVPQIPYAFSNIIEFDFQDRIKIKSVLKEIEESLSVNGDKCIEFVERINQKDYILFVDKGDCSSGIGYYPGNNKISLSRECLTTGTIIHEVMHR